METFDVVVIGGGPGGYPAAIRSAQLGAKTAIIEKEFVGGTCLNCGCIPTKTLIAAGELYHKINHADAFGIKVGSAEYDYKAFAGRKDDVILKLRGGIESLLKANGVTVFRGTGSFISRNRIAVENSDGITEIGAKKTIIATGSDSVMPGFIPESKNILDSKAFLELKKLPSSLLVLGGGVIGCEFACLAAQLGVKVTVVEMLDDILPMLDKDVRRQVRRYMEKELQIDIMTGAPLEKIEANSKTVKGKVGDKEVKADMMLVAIGRRPVTAGLMPENAGVKLDERGFIPVNPNCSTSAATVYAVGDVVAGSTQLAHAATAQGTAAAENAVLGKDKNAETLIPACIFTMPEVGVVGLSETEAAEAGIEINIGKFSFAALGKAMAMGDTTGFVKWIVDAETDRLIGAQAVGPHATELIAEAAVAVHAELTAAELGATVHSHPTLSESWMEAAHVVHGSCVHAPPSRRKK